MLNIDLMATEELSTLLPEQTLLTSSLSGWEDVGLCHVLLLPKTCHEHRFKQHLLLINLERELENTRTIGSRTQHRDLSAGDVVFIPEQTTTSVTSLYPAEKIGLWLNPEFVAKKADEVFGIKQIEWEAQFAKPDPLIEHMGRSLLKELQTNYSSSREYAAVFAGAIAVHLIKNYASQPFQDRFSQDRFFQDRLSQDRLFQNPNGSVSSEAARNGSANQATTASSLPEGLSRYQLTQTLDYIHSQLDRPIKVANVASKVDISPYHFSRLFKQSTGLSPYQYVMQQRVEKAKRLLRQRPNLPIAEIALQCGFTHQSHLAKYFRRMTGTTPKIYRRQ